MTGYAFCENTDGNKTVSVEIKGYNNRFLELSVYLPSWLSSLEPVIRDYMSSRFYRGKIDINIKVREYNSEISVSVNTAAAKAYYTAMEELAAKLEIKQKPDLSLLLNMEGVLDTEKNRDSEKYLTYIQPVLTSAADQFESERSREGQHTLEDILCHITVLEESTRSIETHAGEIENSIKENLRTRFNEVLGNAVDENRILSETAVLLMKYTISEELSRLSSHLAEFRHEAADNPVPGKKLDFLSQEINREINTIGSKTPLLEVSRLVVEMKNALENIREQLRNVE